LPAEFCQDDPVNNFTYRPVNSTPPTNRVTGAGVIDNLDGTATFNPATAGVGVHIITYTFVEVIGGVLTCTNLATRSVQVFSSPVATFSGLNASSKYCSGAADVTLTGNNAPAGVFSGDGIQDNGNGTALFKPTTLGVGTYSITYTYVNSNGCSDSKTSGVEIIPLPTSYTVTGGGSRCELSSGVSIGLSGSSSSINYKLYRDGVAVSPDNTVSGTGAAISFGSLSAAGTYTVVATNSVSGCTSQMNGNAVVSVTSQLAITTQPVNASACEAGSASFTVEATGPGRHYQWYNGGTAVGIDNNVLILSSLPLTDSGKEIYCIVTSSSCGGPITSNKAILTVNPINKILTQPVSALKCAGGGVTFSVTGEGYNPQYKWKKGATDVVNVAGRITGNNTTALTIANLVAGDAGLYSCEISGGCGVSVTSSQATLTVNDPIVITTQPVNVTACAGTNVSMSVVATPSSGLTYQWLFNNGGGGGFVSVGVNSPGYPINGVSSSNAGTYYCRISNGCGATLNTNQVILTVPVATGISADPVGDLLCEGAGINLTVTAVGDALSYEWYKDGDSAPLTDNSIVQNTSASSLSFTGLTLAYAGNYRVKVTGTCGTETSAPDAILDIKQKVVITSQPASITRCSGSDASFSVTTTGDVLSYKWYNSIVGLISGATGSSYTITGATSSNAGNYWCVISTLACGPVTSSQATLTINPLTSISVHPLTLKAGCLGNNVSFSVTATGIGITYQWYKNMVSMGALYQNQILNLTNISATDAGSYTCLITGSCGPAQISNPGVLTVDIPPVISTHPQSNSVCLDATHQLNIVLSEGTNPGYQWYFDNDLNGTFVSVSGATSQVLTISTFDATEAGDYYCVVTNGCSSVTSQTARLLLIDEFSITTSISNATVCENGSKTFTIVANQPVSYRWMKNGTAMGITNQSLVLNNIPYTDNGAVYSCEVYNNCKAQIVSATLSVSRPLSITQQPQNDIACSGDPYSIVIVATGTNPQYQWYKASATALTGKTASSLTFSAFDPPTEAGTYYCVVSNGCGSVTSGSAVITGGAAVAITNDPDPSSLCIGTDASFTVTATGTNLVYEWRKNYIPLADDGRIVGSGTATLAINNVVAGDEETYDVIVSGSCGLDNTSSGAYLEITTPPVITINPEPLTICSGGDASFSVTVPLVDGDPLPVYQWQEDGTAIDPAVNISAATSTLILSGATTGAIYNCKVTNACGFITSTSAELIIEKNVTISGQPASDQTLCKGSNVSFTAVITGPTDMTLRWYKADGTPTGTALTNGGRISGADLLSLSISNIASSDAGTYFCKATSSCGISYTTNATLVVHERITITQQPQDITVCPAGTLALNVIASGTVTSYTWKRGATVVGSGSSYSASPFNSATHAGNYTCEVKNICETVISDVVVVTTGIQTAATISSDITDCEGHNASFTVSATGNNLTYTWYKGATELTDGGRIGGSQSAILTITGLVPGDGATYQCDVSGSCGFDNDNSALLTVNTNVAFNVQPVSVSALIGTTATFTVAASGTITGYQWYYKGITPLADAAGEISGATTAVLRIFNAQQVSDEGAYHCVVSGSCGNSSSNSANLSVIPVSMILTQPVATLSICENTTFGLTISATPGVHTYQWRRGSDDLTDGGGVTGATASSFTITAALLSDAGAYTCLLDGVEISSASIVTINPSTVINTYPVGGTKCTGDMHIFSVTAAGAGLNYQWYTSTGSITGATSREYKINSLVTGDAGSYYCIVTGTCLTKTSNTVTLVVNRPVSVVAQPAATTTLCQGSSTSLIFNVTGTGLTYLWHKNGQAITDGNISDINTSTLVISNSAVSNSGSYTCTVSGACSTPVTSSTATVTIVPTTAITTQPVSSTVCEGDAVTFTVAAAGTTLVYKWFRDGTDLGLASSPTLTISNVTKASHEGNYTCLVTGACGAAVNSENAVLTVNRNTAIGSPSISANPICQNGSTTITITATGDGLTYLWKKYGQPISVTNITGKTTSTLVISNALATDGGIYTCTVTGACGSPLTSTNAVVTVNQTTAITTEPSNYIRCAGDEVLFKVEAVGNISAYQWKIGGAGGTDLTNGTKPSGAVISGASTSQLKITGVSTSEAGSYACVITSPCGNLNSSSASLTVNVPIQITTQPPTLTSKCQGVSTEINVTVTGTVTSYKWKKGSTELSNGGNISGVNTSKLVISNLITTDAGFYSCEISGYCNTVNTQSAELAVNPLPAFTLNPSGATLCENENIQLISVATGAEPLTYQWKLNNADITSTTSSTLTLNGVTPSDAGAYTCYVTAAACGNATSTPATINVNPSVDISIQPVNTNACKGTTAIFSVTASGTATLSYRWKFNNVNLTNTGRVTGATSSELRISSAEDADEGIYKCEITSTCGTEISSSAILSVDETTAITVNPLSQAIVPGTNAIFGISAAGVISGYKWKRNGLPISDGVKYSGTDSPVLTVLNVSVSDAASYVCIVTGSCGIATSDPGLLTVIVPAAISASPASISRCTNESASFSVAASGTNLSYQWVFNGTNLADGPIISGSQTSNLVISSVTSAHEGNYSCIVTGAYNVANSSNAFLTVNNPPAIVTPPVSQTLCIGDWLILEVTATGDGLSYVWEKNGVAVGSDIYTTGINTPLLVITNVTSAYAGVYRCRVFNSCQTRWSSDASITVNPAATLVTNPVGNTKCEGQTTTFSVSASGVDIQYQWYKGGILLNNSTRITGVQTNTLTITGIVKGDQDSYSCTIRDNCNSINSATSILTVRENVAITSQPQSLTICSGQNSYFNVGATGYNLNYKWQKDGTDLSDGGNITGSGTSTLVISNATIGDMGVYRCFLDGYCNDILTGAANLIVNSLPAAAGVVSGSTGFCQGTKGVLYTVLPIANATSYAWTLPYNAAIVSGAGTRSIIVDFLPGATSGVVSVHGVNGCADGAESPSLTVNVNAMPDANAGSEQILCSDVTNFGAVTPAFGAGIWTKISGQGIIETSSNPHSLLTGTGQGDNLFVWSVSQSGCTARDTVKIINRRVFVDAGTDQIICSLTSTLNAVIPAIGTGSWSIIAGGGSFSSMTDPKTAVINLARGANTLRWSINNGGCISYDEVILRNDLPTNSVAGADTILIVDNYTLAANNPLIGTGQWTLLGGSATITNPNQFNTTVTGLGIGENLFRWTITNNLCYNSDEVKVINFTPTNTDAGSNQTLCVEYTTLAGTKPNYGTGQWTVVAGSATFKDPFKNDTEVINIGKGQNVYRWTIFEYKITYDDVVITNNSPSTANAGIDLRLCSDNAVVGANNPVIGTGNWSVIGGSGNITNQVSYNSAVTNLGTGSNTFRWTITSGACSSFDEVIVTNDQPTFADAGGDQLICQDSVNLYPNTPTIGVGEWSVVKGQHFSGGIRHITCRGGRTYLNGPFSIMDVPILIQ
jgi:hypothetical protein